MSVAARPGFGSLLRGPGVPLRAGLRPVLLAGGSIAAVALLAGALPWLTGADPARTVLRARQLERDADPAAVAAVRAELDLPTSPVAGAWQWLGRAGQGDLGVSWVSGGEVIDMVGPALTVSLNLAGFSALVALALAIALVAPRIFAVGRGRPAASPALQGVSAALAAAPEFVIAVVLASVFAVRLGWLPSSGWRTPADMVLPVASLAIGSTGVLVRVLTTAVAAAAAEDWVHTWRANGARPSRIARALTRRAVAVALPQVMLLLAGIVGAAVLVEDVYAIPGLGRLTLDAALAQDLPVVQGSIGALVLLGVIVGTVGTVTHALLMRPALGAGHGAALVRRDSAAPLPAAWWVSAAALTVLVGGGLLRSVEVSPEQRHQPPSWTHPLGTDHVGRDVWARVGEGALLTIGLAVTVGLVCLALGLAVGLASRHGAAGVADVLNAVPSVFLGLVMAAVLGPGLFSAALAITLVGWIPLAVHTRTLAAQARAAGFHQAAVVAGANRRWILTKHLLPAVLRPVTGHAVVRLAHLALALTGLGFLGLGAGHDSAEWGKLLADSVLHLERAPWAVAAPTVGLVLLGLVANLARQD